MKINGKHYRTVWLDENQEYVVHIIDQRFLPHQLVIEKLTTVHEVAHAIREMQVRGAGLIGATAGYGMYLAAKEASGTGAFDEHLNLSADILKSSRPTAVNLEWAVNRQLKEISNGRSIEEKIRISKNTAEEIANQDAEHCRNIGLHGMKIIEDISNRKNGDVVNILTHCNAGWLAFVDHGSATAPIYEAFDKKIPLHVWVDETRPRNQGASLTAWELLNQGIPHTVITDNAGGHLMQHGMVDMVITGADRVTRTGDVANKIGTYLKALAAYDNNVPFYTALPSSTFDWNIRNGIEEINIEERSGDEVKYVYGWCDDEIKKVLVTPFHSPASNFGFDITPSRLITSLITERGICGANEEDIMKLFTEQKAVLEK